MDTVFLVLSLFLPRLTLFIYYFFVTRTVVPWNLLPCIGNLALGIILPRVLILIFVADTLGTSSPWFWIHLVAAVINYTIGWKNKHRVRRRRG